MAYKERNSRSWIHGLERACDCRSLRWHGSHRLSVSEDVTIGRPAHLYRADERGAKAANQKIGTRANLHTSSLAIAGTFPGDERLDEPLGRRRRILIEHTYG